MIDTPPDLLPETPALPAVTGPTVRELDAQALANLALLDPSGANLLLPRVLSTYLGSLARLMLQLRAARQPFNPDAVKLAVHTLKSSSASVGALVLSGLCGAAENAVRDAQFGGLPAILDDLEAEAKNAEAAVHQLLMRL